MNISIGTAEIHFSDTYWFEHRCHHVFDITFEKTSSLQFNNLVFITAGSDEDSAKDYLEAVKKYFSTAGIREGSDVALLFSGDRVLAISARGNDLWIDVSEGIFHYISPKRFRNLGITIDSLEVY